MLRDVIFSTAQSAALGPTKEGRFLLPGSDRRPADVLIPYLAGGRDAALDVTVINPLQTATLADAAARPGSALTVAFTRNIVSAEELTAQCAGGRAWLSSQWRPSPWEGGMRWRWQR